MRQAAPRRSSGGSDIVRSARPLPSSSSKEGPPKLRSAKWPRACPQTSQRWANAYGAPPRQPRSQGRHEQASKVCPLAYSTAETASNRTFYRAKRRRLEKRFRRSSCNRVSAHAGTPPREAVDSSPVPKLPGCAFFGILRLLEPNRLLRSVDRPTAEVPRRAGDRRRFTPIRYPPEGKPATGAVPGQFLGSKTAKNRR
jgi:hypothetical protein